MLRAGVANCFAVALQSSSCHLKGERTWRESLLRAEPEKEAALDPEQSDRRYRLWKMGRFRKSEMEPAGRKPDQLEVALRKQQCPELIFVSQDVAGRGRPSFASPVSRQIRSAGRRGCIQRDGGQWHRGLATARGSKPSTACEIDRGPLERCISGSHCSP